MAADETKTAFSLEIIDVATPCTADWDGMTGDERVRFCGQCSMNVYNLSELPRRDAEALVQNHEGRLCVRFYRRADGTVITRDCPVGLAKLRRGLVRAWGVAAALAAFLVASVATAWWSEAGRHSPSPFAQLREAITPVPVPMVGEVVQGGCPAPSLGKIAIPSPAIPPANTPPANP